MNDRMADEHRNDAGSAGASARRKAQRLRERREQSAASRSGLARLAAVVMGPPAQEKQLIADEKRWAIGAQGEQTVAEMLARRCPGVPVLHDRRMPRSQANIDHLAFAASGLYVIDTKRYRGKIEVVKPLFGQAKLKIGGRDRTKLLDGLDKQVAAVRAALAGLADDVPVHGCLCFVPPEGLLADSGLPVLRTLKINGYPLYYPRRLAKRLNSDGPLTDDRARSLCADVAQRLPPAGEN